MEWIVKELKIYRWPPGRKHPTRLDGHVGAGADGSLERVVDELRDAAFDTFLKERLDLKEGGQVAVTLRGTRIVWPLCALS